MENNLQNNIVIYQTEDGKTHIDVKLQDDTIWLTQDMIVKLFDSSKANISEHIKHIYEDQELSPDSTVRNFRTVRKEGTRTVSRNLEYYNLDMIISVGYRVNSTKATKFRIWATSTLKDYLTKGYAINEQRLKQEQSKVQNLQNTINLLSRSLTNQVDNLDDGQMIAKIMSSYANGLTLLDSFDHKTLDTKGISNKPAVRIPEEEFLKIIDKMKSKYASDVFANPKDKSFSSSVNQIYQTFDGKELYPTLEEKAAMLLYLITKNHSFSDGNKRIAASCFLYFLEKNKMLDKLTIFDSGTLFALTLLIAESNPDEMETIKNVVVSILNGGVNND